VVDGSPWPHVVSACADVATTPVLAPWRWGH
jgi:hypothetical protein